jgi:hypothetical protein
MIGTNAQSAEIDCDAFSKALTDSEMDISTFFADTIVENSAVRAQHYDAQMSNALLLWSVNFQLLNAHKCPIPLRPVPKTGGYLTAALACKTALVKGNTNAPECDRTKWIRDK